MILFRPLIRYADFKGRASRSEYWLFALVQGVWYTLLIGLALISITVPDDGLERWGSVIALGMIPVSVLALVVPNYAVLVRRLHDTGRGAIWVCLMLPSIVSSTITALTIVTAMSAVGLGASREAFVGTALAGLGAAGVLGLIGMVCQMIMLTITLLPGTRGENRFGPDPRDPTARYGSGGGGTAYDDDRLEALFAEAKRANGAGEEPYRPVFDFGPGPTSAAPPTRPASPPWHPSAPGTVPAPTFGRRGT